MKKQTGISLLEIVLVLAIIAVIMLAAARFFNIANENAKVNNAVSMIREVTDASYKWYQMDNNFSDITLQKLVDLNLLPKKYSEPNNINPWGGSLSIGSDETQQKLQITLEGIPHKGTEKEDQPDSACEKLVKQLAEFNSAASNCSIGKFVGDF